MRIINFTIICISIILLGCSDSDKIDQYTQDTISPHDKEIEAGYQGDNKNLYDSDNSNKYLIVRTLPRPQEMDYNLSDDQICCIKKYKTIDLVLVHGLPRTNHLGGAIGGFDPMVKYLKSKFTEEQLIIHKIAIPNFSSLTIVELAKELHKYLKKIPGIKKGGDHGLILLGHCAGTFTCFETLCRYASEYNTCSMISISGVWKGIRSKNFRQHKGVIGMIHKQYLKAYKNYKSFDEFDPKGNYVCGVGSRLENLDPEIKIYAIGGYTTILDDISKNRILKSISGIGNSTEYDIFGSKYHDIFVDLDSQLGVGLPRIYRCTLKEPAFHVILPHKDMIAKIDKFVSGISPHRKNDLVKLFQLLNNEVPARAHRETHRICEKVIRASLIC